MAEPLISVVIPCYNGAEHLDECLRSVLVQNTSCEIIIVDDGSTDDSWQVCRRWAQATSTRVLAISQANQGPAAARNCGLRMAAGKYICFLDVDDRYAPGFFASAVSLLEAQPSVVAVTCEIELVRPHREVTDWQRETIENSLPSNLLVRTETARRLGGFSTAAAFRGQAAGEDCAFRIQLHRCGTVLKIPQPLLKYHVRPHSHFDFFLDRAVWRDGHVEFSHFSKEESDGSFMAALQQYEESIQRRAIDDNMARLQSIWNVIAQFHDHSARFAGIEGFLHPWEGLVLCWLAEHWPVEGRVVEVGSFKGLSTCWLASGCQRASKRKVAAVDHFAGSSEHQHGGTHPDPDIAAQGNTLATFQANVQKCGLADWVTTHQGRSSEIAGNWQEPIRLLFLDGDHSDEGLRQDLASWTPWLSRDGLVVLHDVGAWPGPTCCYQQLQQLASRGETWRDLGQFYTLGILQRI